MIRMNMFMIVIRGREIYYNDKINKLQMIYPTPSEKAIELSGKPTEEEVKEYELCKTEKELASFVIKDCLKSGAKLIKMEEV